MTGTLPSHLSSFHVHPSIWSGELPVLMEA
jgi:hypothetical protein